MSDDRFTFLHVRNEVVQHLIGSDDFVVDLPDEDIDVPFHLIPPYQDEEEESALPLNTHSSYPFGNPYRPTANSRVSMPFSMTSRSLATTLPSLYLARLGLPAQNWKDLALDQLLPFEEVPEASIPPNGVNDSTPADGADGAAIEDEGVEGEAEASEVSGSDGGDMSDDTGRNLRRGR